MRVFLFYIAAALVIHIDRFLLGPYALFKTHDQFDSLWPYQNALADRILSFQMPGWFPDYLGGMPFFSWDINWLFFPMIIGGLFPGPWGLTATSIMQFLLAALGGYLFLKHFFKTDEYTNIAGGLLWALSTFDLTYWRIFDLAPIPMLLYCTDAISAAQEKKRRVMLVVGLVVCALNMYIAKGALFIAFFQIFFIFFANKMWNRRQKVLITYTLFWVFVGLLNLPLIVSLLMNISISVKGFQKWIYQDSSVRDYLHNLYLFVTYPLLIPYNTIGLIGSLVLFFSFFQFRKWNRLAKLMLFYVIAALVAVKFVVLSKWFLSWWQTTPISGFQLNRLVFLSPFIFFVIAITNFDRFIRFMKSSFKTVLLLTSVSGIMLASYYLSKPYNPSHYIIAFVIVLFTVVFAAASFIIRKYNLDPKTIAAIIIALMFMESIIKINLIRPADVHPPSFAHFFESDLFESVRPEHKYDYRISFINWHPSVGLYNGYQVAGGFANYLKRYANFWEALLTRKTEAQQFSNYPYIAYLHDNSVLRESHPPKVIQELTFNPVLLALNNVRYIFSMSAIAKPERWGLALARQGQAYDRAAGWKRGIQIFKRIFKSIPYFVYEIKDYFPRIFTVHDFILVKDETELKTYLQNADFDTLKNTVVYNRQDLQSTQIRLLTSMQARVRADKISRSSISGTPDIVQYEDNQIIIDIMSEIPQQLVLIDNFARDWTVQINGQEASILPAYGTFRSVIINKGSHRIVFEYKPIYLIQSFWVSGIGCLIFVLIVIFWAFRMNPLPGKPMEI